VGEREEKDDQEEEDIVKHSIESANARTHIQYISKKKIHIIYSIYIHVYIHVCITNSLMQLFLPATHIFL